MWLQKTHKADQRAVTAGEDVISQSQRDKAAAGAGKDFANVANRLVANMPLAQRLSAMKAAMKQGGEVIAKARAQITGQEVAAKQSRKSEVMGLAERNKDRRRQNIQFAVQTAQGPSKSASDAPYETIQPVA